MALIPIGLGANFSGIAQNLAYAGVIAVIVIICGVCAYLFSTTQQYTVDVLIFSKRSGSNNYKVFRDKGGYIKNKLGGFDFKLKRFKKVLPPPTHDFLMVDSKGKNQITLYQISENYFYYVKPSFVDKENKVLIMKSSDEDIRFWAALDMQRSRNTFGKPDLLEKLMPIMVIAVTGLFCMLLLYFTVGAVKDVALQLGSISQNLGAIVQGLHGTSVQPAPVPTAPY